MELLTISEAIEFIEVESKDFSKDQSQRIQVDPFMIKALSDQARVQTLDRGTETGLICGTDFSSKRSEPCYRTGHLWTKFGRHDTLLDPLPVVNYYLIGEVQN